MNKQMIICVFVFVIMFCCIIFTAQAADGINAKYTTSVVSIDDNEIIFAVFEINGQQYFRIRDIAYALIGTRKQFNVAWDADTRTVTITSGLPYSSVTLSEIHESPPDDKTAIKISHKYLADGKTVHIVTYNIDDESYVRLTDIGNALNFYTLWNESTGKYFVDTDRDSVIKTSTLLAETDDMGQEYLDSIVFLGDSTTYGLLAYKTLPGGRNSNQVWTPANRTFSLFKQNGIKILYPETGKEITIEQAVSLKQPEYMLITLGINGVSMMDESWFKRDYMALISRIMDANANTKVILNSIYPIARSYKNKNSINNEKIMTANAWIYEIAEEMGLRYIDTNSSLKDEDGWLPEAYQNGDGLHLTPEAFKKVLNHIRTHGYT